MAILDLSKVMMYDFYYGYMKVKYGEDAELCFTDTDSLLYDVKCDNIYSDMAEDADRFDFSDYPTDNPLFQCYQQESEFFINLFYANKNLNTYLLFLLRSLER